MLGDAWKLGQVLSAVSYACHREQNWVDELTLELVM
jgi:hypothetical protein